MSGSHGHRDRHTLPPSIGAPSHQKPLRRELPALEALNDEQLLDELRAAAADSYWLARLNQEAIRRMRVPAGMKARLTDAIEKLGELVEALRP